MVNQEQNGEKNGQTSQELSMSGSLKAPFPFFGGKSVIARLVWDRFGNVPNLVDPFFGSGAVLLSRPHPPQLETINDLDGMICNFWRAVTKEPETVAKWADHPINECDLTARHIWLVNRKDPLQEKLEGDPNYFDAKIAGWWVWGMCCWIGSGFCLGNGPWNSENGVIVNLRPRKSGKRNGVNRKLPHLGDGKGVNRQLPHLSNQFSDGKGVCNSNIDIYEWFSRLSERLRRVRVCCGDWKRIMGPSVTTRHGITGIFLDPPYSDTAGRYPSLYATEDLKVAHDVWEWCIENGDNPLLRIALCGYEGEHEMPESWEKVAWKTNGGYANQGYNRAMVNKLRERIWFSPHCLKGEQIGLF